MNCPHCQKEIHGTVGLHQIHALQKHLARCTKNPSNIVLTDGERTVVVPPDRRRAFKKKSRKYECPGSSVWRSVKIVSNNSSTSSD